MAEETFVFNMNNADPVQADELFFRADEKIKAGAFPEAKAMLEQALEINPKHGRANNHLGWLYETKYQDLTKAEEYYKKAIEFAPEYPPGYTNYAVALSTLERYDELAQLLEKAMNVPGINKEALYNEYGIMYERQGKFQEAIEHYQKGLNMAMNDNAIERYKKSIDRCKTKMG